MGLCFYVNSLTVTVYFLVFMQVEWGYVQT